MIVVCVVILKNWSWLPCCICVYVCVYVSVCDTQQNVTSINHITELIIYGYRVAQKSHTVLKIEKECFVLITFILTLGNYLELIVG